MRALLISCVILFSFCQRSFAQVGNEWIVFNQQYFKIPVGKEGIYRLNLAALQSAGFPAASVDPQKIQLCHRGEEQSIYIEGESDGQFDPTDFIEFYGQRNDGTLDAGLYENPTDQPHTLYNLYTDTTAYFLTVGVSTGKRMLTFYENNDGGLIAEDFHIDEKTLVLTSQYATGQDYGEIQKTTFGMGEGWGGPYIFQGGFGDNSIGKVTNAMQVAGNPELEVLLVGRGPMGHSAEVMVGQSNRLLGTVEYEGYESFKFIQPIEWTDIAADGTLNVRIKVKGFGGPDRLSVSYIKLRYPQSFDVSGATEKTFLIEPNVGGKSYIEIVNPSAGLVLLDVTDPNNITRIGTSSTSSLNAVVPSTTDGKKIFTTNTILTPSIKAVTFRQIIPSQHNYIIISNPLLRTAALGYSDPVKGYAEYRASVEGGSYDTLIVNVQQLFDQFNYGESSPLAIYQFMKFLSNVKVPKYLLLIGRGLDPYHTYYRTPSAFTTYKDLVPSAGFPGSDMVFTAGLAGTAFEPAVPTGRIPALKPDDVASYLNKVKEMELLPFNDLWRKNILHLSGGIAEGEPELFKGYMEDFQSEAEDYHLGGKVSALAKYSKDIQQINVAEQVNNGLNLITFFGHSSTTTTDFDIGFVTDPILGYNNKGKYPMLLMNGCNVGSFFIQQTLFGEDWVLAKDKGATGFIGHSAYGFTHLLKLYTSIFYEVAYQDSAFIRQGIGDIQKETAKRLMDGSLPVPSNITQVQQMVLLGDPAVKLFGASKPDLEIKDNDVNIESFDGNPVTALADSFAINLIVRNYGQAREDTIRVEVLRTLNDNSTITYDSLFQSTKYSDTLTFVIRKGREAGFGNNSFRITLDPDDILPELNEQNNVANELLFIPLNGTKNLFPADFAIVNSQQTTLSFQTTDLLSAEQDFLLEVDTVNTFDSNLKQQFVVKGKVLARHAITLLSSDTTAYYWRTKLANPKPGESTEWTNSSFTYISGGVEGWAQVHFPQYLDNQAIGLVADGDLRRLRFEESETTIAIKTFGGNHPGLNTDVSVKIAGAEYNTYTSIFICRDNSLNLIAFDRKSAVPYLGVKFEWYNRGLRTCGRKPSVINNFVPSEMVTPNHDDLIQYVDNVQAGDSVLLFTIGNGMFSAWPAAAKAKLEQLGISSSQLSALQDGEPVVILGRKGAVPGNAKIFTAQAAPKDTQELVMNGTITGGYTAGTMSSGMIGPAVQWDSLLTRPVEIEASDVINFDVIGVKMDGEEQIILDDVTGDQDLNTINAAEFPYLKIVFSAGDDVSLTPAQLNKWLVTFTPAPEGLLVYNGIHEQETIEEGGEWKGKYGFVNISDKPFVDSLTVKYEVFNQTTRTSRHNQVKIKAPAPGDTTSFEVAVETLNQAGISDVEVYVNPKVLPELYYDNNILQLADHLNVENEELNPVLDVTIDGRYVANGDYVSSDPFIEARIWDENIYILKKDTAGVRIFLTYPCDIPPCTPVQILLTDEDIKWHPATDTSVFRVEYTPNQLADGEYRLRIEGADSRGNRSGVEPYEVTFNVLNETTVTIADPYPNPFSQEVYFRIVLSGNAIPETMGIQLFNVNGQIQSEFTESDLEALHIGTNEIVWKGTDRMGNTLPGGVYIYEIKLLINGQQTRKLGKLVLMR
ncbi:MAG TPA: C25 family cysteine peptidase [Chryseolinea sp.]|nr:C25 family cysteine peptidase [Chryseolinea sp.]